MQRFIISIGCIVIGLVLGARLKQYDARVRKLESNTPPRYIAFIRSASMLCLNPILMCLVFWIADWSKMKMLAVPVLGVGALISGGALGILYSKISKLDNKRAGSLFSVSSFSNLGTACGLVCYMFFGEIGVVYVTMYKLLEEMYYYMVGFPIVHMYGSEGESFNRKAMLRKIITDPYVLLYLAAFIIGTSLNLFGVKRPAAFGGISEFLIVFNSLLLVTAVGYTMRLNKIGKYWKECVCTAAIKFILVPAIVISAALLLGFRHEGDGILFMVLVVVSFAPPAFNSLIAPQIYGLDIDLANSCWVICNVVFLFLVVPLLALVLNARLL